jgi:imidazolonepropionase-like amidohydrolase
MIAIVGGTLLDGTGSAPLHDSTVVIDGSHIAAAGSRAETVVPGEATVLNATGQTVLPGLIDLHQHLLHEWDKALFPKNGITSVRFAGGKQSSILRLRQRIRSGELIGPRIFSVGPIMDRPPTARPQSALVVNDLAEAASQAERLIREENVDALFAARRIDREFLRVILDVAHSHGKPVTGQVYELSGRQAAAIGIDGLENTSRIPESAALDETALHSYRSVSHRLGMLGRLWATASDSVMRDVLGVMAERRVEWAPGLVSFEHWAGFLNAPLAEDPDYREAPEEVKSAFSEMKSEISKEWTEETISDWEQGLEKAKSWIGYYHKIGGAIVTGTDTPLGAITFHRELRNLRDAGLSSMDIVVAATSRSAQALRHPYLGVIAPGKLADLIVVPGDPLENLPALRHPLHVFVGGRHEIIDGKPRRPITGEIH